MFHGVSSCHLETLHGLVLVEIMVVSVIHLCIACTCTKFSKLLEKNYLRAYKQRFFLLNVVLCYDEDLWLWLCRVKDEREGNLENFMTIIYSASPS